jgi:hypothetical protein
VVIVVVGEQDIPRYSALQGINYPGNIRGGVHQQAVPGFLADQNIAVGLVRAENQSLDKDIFSIFDNCHEVNSDTLLNSVTIG